MSSLEKVAEQELDSFMKLNGLVSLHRDCGDGGGGGHNPLKT